MRRSMLGRPAVAACSLSPLTAFAPAAAGPQDGSQGGRGSAAGLFDGVDLDREWPGSAGDADTGYRPQDKRGFSALAEEFRDRLDAYGRERRRSHELPAFVPTAPAQDDPQVLNAKARHVREQGLGGAVFRSLDGDTADAELTTAVDRGLRGL